MEPDSSAMVEVEGVQIVCRTIGKGPPLLVLNGFAATSADWDPCFIDQLASRHKLILLNNRGIGGSTDDGQSFDIAKLANDAAHVIETLGFERTSVMGWSMGGFIAQTLAVEYPDRVHKLILLSTDSGGNWCRSRLTCRVVATHRHIRHATPASASVAVAAFSKRRR